MSILILSTLYTLPKMTYQDTLSFLFSQLPMYQKVGGIAFKDDLHNIKILDRLLRHPHQAYPTIHIAGTNGKGSTAHMIAAILQAAGLKVGLYTSPHYNDFRERIKVNGGYIKEDFIIEFVEETKKSYAEVQPSFFEITVAMAFSYFKAEKVDLAVIETGLGGEKDSTNIITPILSVITNIGWDHQAILGNTLPEIAAQKAGIVKPEVPVVIGESHPETKIVFKQKAEDTQSQILFADQQLSAQKSEVEPDKTIYQVFKEDALWLADLRVDLSGDYQKFNLQTALQAIEVLNEQQLLLTLIDQKAIRKGLKEIKTLTQMKGRWDIIQDNPTIILDSAHNESAIRLVMDQLEQLSYKQLHIVLGMVRDKGQKKILQLFPAEAIYYFAKPNVPRGMDASNLAKLASSLGLTGAIYESVQMALEAAKQQAEKVDLIYVGGSTFVVAEAL